MSKPVLIGIVFAALVLGYIVYSSLRLGKHKVEVCISFNGGSACSTAAGASEEFARRTATTNACAKLGASGVNETIACENTTPASVRAIQ
ncbi:MAG TPA: hypothetical protein VKV74_14580 [Bryobacteraceae bacterium]|nr:hypothetical protein [Bryobacteraceae bacterium]